MKINEFIRKKTSNLVEYFMELDAKSKLIIVIIITILLIILTTLLGLTINVKPNEVSFIDTVASTYLTQDKLKDYDMYATLVNIGDDFFSKSSQYVKSSKIKEKDVYETIVTTELKKNISKSEFIKLYTKAVERINNEKTKTVTLVPENISTDGLGKYIIKYSCDNNGKNQNIFLGIILNQNSQKYYVWELEVEE